MVRKLFARRAWGRWSVRRRAHGNAPRRAGCRRDARCAGVRSRIFKTQAKGAPMGRQECRSFGLSIAADATAREDPQPTPDRASRFQMLITGRSPNIIVPTREHCLHGWDGELTNRHSDRWRRDAEREEAPGLDAIDRDVEPHAGAGLLHLRDGWVPVWWA